LSLRVRLACKIAHARSLRALSGCPAIIGSAFSVDFQFIESNEADAPLLDQCPDLFLRNFNMGARAGIKNGLKTTQCSWQPERPCSSRGLLFSSNQKKVSDP
jgi:hypothetical protein